MDKATGWAHATADMPAGSGDEYELRARGLEQAMRPNPHPAGPQLQTPEAAADSILGLGDTVLGFLLQQ
jgi:hypothetical protein